MVGIAGSPVGVEGAAGVLERAGQDFTDVAASIASHGRAVSAAWTGSASDAAADAITALSNRAHVGADVVGGVGPVLRGYAAELRAAQAEYEHAAGAAAEWTGVVQAAGADRDAAAGMPTGTLQQSAARDAARAATDAGAAHAAGQVGAAEHTMAAAVARAERANQVAADAIDALTAHLAAMGETSRTRGSSPASTPPSATTPARPWQAAWNASATGQAWRAAEQFGDFAASVSGYYTGHPDQLGTLIGSSLMMEAGIALTAAGAGAEVGGVVLDATGIGAVIGVPANIAAAGVIATGVTLTTVGAAATLDDLTTMLTERDTTGGSADAPAARGDWLDEARTKVPSEWGEGRPIRDGFGTRWEDPSDEGNGVRIDQGNPNNSQPTQQGDHVVIRHNGRVIGRDGTPIPGKIKDDPELSHIPLEEWLTWSTWYAP